MEQLQERTGLLYFFCVMSPEYRNLNGTCRYRSVMTPEIIQFLFLSLLHCIPHELQSAASTRSNEGQKNEIIHSALDGRPVAASKCTLWEGTRIEFATAGYSGCSMVTGCSLWFTAPFHALHIRGLDKCTWIYSCSGDCVCPSDCWERNSLKRSTGEILDCLSDCLPVSPAAVSAG